MGGLEEAGDIGPNEKSEATNQLPTAAGFSL